MADLTGRIAAFYDFTKGGVAATPSDKYGHGTHIAGLIAGSGYKSNGKYMGVAPSTRLIGLKVLDDKGAGYTSDVIAAVEFATENKAALGIDVINMSLGHPIYEPAATDPLVQAVEAAVDAGIVVVISAGNIGMNPTTGQIGYAGITSPGNAPSALTIGAARHRGTAIRSDDTVADFSSRGPTWYDGRIKPDVLAPGQALVATMDWTAELAKNPAVRADYSGYVKLSGTSMAAGVASGVVALMIDANRRDEGAYSKLTPNTVKAIMQYTATPLTDPDPTTPAALEQGTGMINAQGAVIMTRAIEPTTPKKSPWLEYGVTPYSLLGGQILQWSQHIVWGDHIVLGDSVTWSLAGWAEHVVWGDSDHVVWGDHIVWGDSFMQGLNLTADSFLTWSNHIVWGDSTDHIVWGDSYDHIVWGDSLLDHIVWGDSDHVVWGDSVLGEFAE
jgi:serine protease AprX